jgi:hypothetical protein
MNTILKYRPKHPVLYRDSVDLMHLKFSFCLFEFSCVFSSSIIADTCHIGQLKQAPSVWRFNWATLSLGIKFRNPGPPGWGLGMRLTTPSHKRHFVENKNKNGGQNTKNVEVSTLMIYLNYELEQLTGKNHR